MDLVNGQWYRLPNGTRVQVSAVGSAPDWYLLADASGVPYYGVYAFGLRQFVYDRELGDFRGIVCELTLNELCPTEAEAAGLRPEPTVRAPVRPVRARRPARPLA